VAHALSSGRRNPRFSVRRCQAPVVLQPRAVLRLRVRIREVADAIVLASRDRRQRRKVPGVGVERSGNSRLDVGGTGPLLARMVPPHCASSHCPRSGARFAARFRFVVTARSYDV